MYNVLDVSRYIINYSNDKNYGISNLRLQKLLYFVQAYFLLNKDEQCFDDVLEAWKYGPVSPLAYEEFKDFGTMEIPKIDSYIKINSKNMFDVERIEFDKNCIDKSDRELINEVIDNFKDRSTLALVDITHKQTPWKSVYKPYENNYITIESMKEYFGEKYENQK